MKTAALLKIAEEYLALTRPVARSYPDDQERNRAKFGYRRNLLRSFVQFWVDRGRIWPISSALVFDWVAQGAKPEQPYRDRHRLFTVRGFLIHLRTVEPNTEVPRNVFRKPRRRIPRLLSDEEIGSLMNATAKLRACSIFRRAMLATLVGVLASTGLRIGEALRLNENEVHLDANPAYLTIRDTKFGKSRIVILHPTTAVHLRKFAKLRAESIRDHSPQTFFASQSGKPLPYNSTRTTFLRLVRHAEIIQGPGQKHVNLHSLRHGFAIRRLTLWHKGGANVVELLPHLSVYMGHVDPKDTYWYLTATAELLGAASSRFEEYQNRGAER
ncbi:MAG TPA: tyrosine-type recombinase/integrase [Bryobacteraceae bacterium]|jgi:integrase